MRSGGRTDGPPIGDNGAQVGPPKGSEVDGGSLALWGNTDSGVDVMSPAGGSSVDWATRGGETGDEAPCPRTTRGGEANRPLLGTNGGMSTPTRANETDSGPMSYTDGYFKPIRRHREANGGPVESDEVDDRPVKVGVNSPGPIRCVGAKYAPMGANLSCNLRMGGDRRVSTGPIIQEKVDDGKIRRGDRDTRATRDEADDDEGTAVAHGKPHLTTRVVVHEVSGGMNQTMPSWQPSTDVPNCRTNQSALRRTTCYLRWSCSGRDRASTCVRNKAPPPRLCRKAPERGVERHW